MQWAPPRPYTSLPSKFKYLTGSEGCFIYHFASLPVRWPTSHAQKWPYIRQDLGTLDVLFNCVHWRRITFYDDQFGYYNTWREQFNDILNINEQKHLNIKNL